MTIAHRAVVGAVAVLAMLLVACGGDSPEATPTTTPAPETTSAPVALGTPRPTSTPYTAIEPPATGRIRTTFSVSCDIGPYGAEIHVGYDIAVLNTDEPAATLTRIKLYVDGVLREDTGRISNKVFLRQSTLEGVPRRLHTIQLHIETWAAPDPRDLIEFAQCPALPDSPVA